MILDGHIMKLIVFNLLSNFLVLDPILAHSFL
jgi:hypothetical protein